MDEYLEKALIALNEAGIRNLSQFTSKDKITIKYNDPVCVDSICFVLGDQFSILSELFGDETFSDFDSALTVFINEIKVSKQINIENILII